MLVEVVVKVKLLTLAQVETVEVELLVDLQELLEIMAQLIQVEAVEQETQVMEIVVA
jgi:hypothetical protein